MNAEVEVIRKRFWWLRALAYYLWMRATGKDRTWLVAKLGTLIVCRMNDTTVTRA